MIELGKLNLKAAGAIHDPFVGMRKLELLGLSRNNEIEELVGREYTEGACP